MVCVYTTYPHTNTQTHTHALSLSLSLSLSNARARTHTHTQVRELVSEGVIPAKAIRRELQDVRPMSVGFLGGAAGEA